LKYILFSHYTLFSIYEMFFLRFFTYIIGRQGNNKNGGESRMGKRKKDPSKTGLSNPNVKGQGTTTVETGEIKADASRKKHGR
jgi:hypothetical protein